MNSVLIAVLLGAVPAAILALLVRAAPAQRRLRMHAVMLLAAAAAYVAFAARAEAWSGAAVETVGAAVYGAMAIAGLRRHEPGWLALGWALHPLWDVALHTSGTMEAYTPDWYVAACVGFDLLLAGVIAAGWAGIPARVDRVPVALRG